MVLLASRLLRLGAFLAVVFAVLAGLFVAVVFAVLAELFFADFLAVFFLAVFLGAFFAEADAVFRGLAFLATIVILTQHNPGDALGVAMKSTINETEKYRFVPRVCQASGGKNLPPDRTGPQDPFPSLMGHHTICLRSRRNAARNESQDHADRKAPDMKQFVITPAMGKRLIGKAVAARPDVRAVLRKGTLVIVAGTTNAYVAQEVLALVGGGGSFTPRGFRRGIVLPPDVDASRIPAPTERDVVLVDGVPQEGEEIFDVADDLRAGDMIVKGANALHLGTRRAAVLVGHPQTGTAGAAIPAVVGRRVKLLVPVGLEKRVEADVADLAGRLNAPGATGPRMLVLPGEVFTELDAIAALSGAEARLVAAGGVCGAEGAVWIAVTGSDEQVATAETLIAGVADEPPCRP